MWTTDQRTALLSQTLARAVSRGGRVEWQNGPHAVVAVEKRPRRGHLACTIFTFGLWAPIWFMAYALSRTVRTTYFVDEYGRLSMQKNTRHR